MRWRDRVLVGAVDRAVFSKVRATLGGRLRWAVAGGAALSPDVAEFIDALGIAVYEGYGLTETSPVISVNTESARRTGSVGRPLPGVRVEVRDDSLGAPTGDGDRARRDGEIVVYGPNVMQGYYGRPDETELALTADGGLRTGDLGYVDDDGFVYVTGRIKEQYKLENGKYVVPTPIEERLKLSPYVVNVMVYGANRPHNVALVVADVVAVRRWAAERRLPVPSDVPSLLRDERIRTLFKREIESRQATLRAFDRIREFELLGCDFTVENGMLTPSQKLKRRKVLEAYREVVERLYSPRTADAPKTLDAASPT
jgi:long-chain acyl-CoA synthetase